MKDRGKRGGRDGLKRFEPKAEGSASAVRHKVFQQAIVLEGMLILRSTSEEDGVSSIWKTGRFSWIHRVDVLLKDVRCSCFLLDDGKMFLFPAG